VGQNVRVGAAGVPYCGCQDWQVVESVLRVDAAGDGRNGGVKDGRIEIQGDQRERIVAELEKLGYKVKRAGG
jgi:translation initiation factor 1 (eIF-1/SUI1)